jgi:hypothetical protein
MKNFHMPLPDRRSKVSTTVLPREAIDSWDRQQLRKARHDAISAYAAETAGTSLDLDAELENAGIEHLIKTGKRSK